MRTPGTAVVALALLSSVVPACAASEVSFHPPAHIQAEDLFAQASLAVVVLPPGQAWQVNIKDATVTGGVRHQYSETTLTGPYGMHVYDQRWVRDVPARTDWTRMNLDPQEGTWTSLVVEAESIHVVAPRSDVTLDVTQGSLAAEWANTQPGRELTYASVVHSRPAPLTTIDAEGVTMVATGLRRVEWHGADTSCPSGQDCPKPSSEGPTAEFVEHHFRGGTLTLSATPHRLVLAGPADLAFNGTARLPRTTGYIDCNECDLTQDALTVRGTVDLALHRAVPGSLPVLEANLDGTFLARVNESPPQSVGTSPPALAAVAVGVGLLVAWRVVAALISQRILDAPLRNPARKRLYQTIDSNPGATGRELQRATGLANGALHHHLHTLERARAIRHWRDGRSIHYAVADASVQAAMRARALDDAATQRFWEHLQSRGGRVQSDLAAWADRNLGWSRGTTQNRLARLCDLGLAEVHADGVRRIYHAVVPERQNDATARRRSGRA